MTEPTNDLEITDEEAAVIDRVAAKLYAASSAKGFHDRDGDEISDDRLAAMIADIHGEASELREASRKGVLYDRCDKPIGLTFAAEETADIAIRAMDTAVALGISLGQAMRIKVAYNRTRPRMHGKVA